MSYLNINGIYDPTKRYAWTNVSEEDFASAWNSSPISVKAGDTVELPQHLAVKFTDELVDKLMTQEFKLDEVKMREKNPDLLVPRSPRGMSLGVPAARKVYEDMICRELAPDEESPQMQIERARIKEELLNQMNAEVSKEPPVTPGSPLNSSEFAELGKSVPEAPKAPLKVKRIPKNAK